MHPMPLLFRLFFAVVFLSFAQGAQSQIMLDYHIPNDQSFGSDALGEIHLVSSDQRYQGKTLLAFKTTIDETFGISAIGEKHVLSGHELYPGVGVHKSVARDGQIYACFGLVTGLNSRTEKEVLMKSALATPKGKVIKRNFLRQHISLAGARKISTCQRANWKTPICKKVFPVDLSLFLGEDIMCYRTDHPDTEKSMLGRGVLHTPDGIRIKL